MNLRDWSKYVAGILLDNQVSVPNIISGQAVSTGWSIVLSFLPNALEVYHQILNDLLVSSPEHEMLMMSYCGLSMSVVRRASFVVRRQKLL